MLIFAIIPIIFLILSYKNFKLAFLAYVAFKMLAVSAMCVKYSPPALSVDTILNVFFVFEFWRRGYFSHYRNKISEYPFWQYTCFSLISIGLSTVYSILPAGIFINSVITTILDNFMLPVLFWVFISKESDVRVFIRCCIVVFTVACGFGIFEFVIHKNIFVDFLYNNFPEELLKGKLIVVGERGGLPRIMSLFVSPNNFIYGGFISLMIFQFNLLSHKKISNFTLFFLCTFCLVVLANSRTVLISFLILSVPIYTNLKSVITRKIFFVTAIILLSLSSSLYLYMDNITSVLSSSSKSEIEGSSVQGRAMQFEGALQLMMQSPIVGNGIGSIGYFLERGWRWIILGTESIWMKMMIERGIIGILSYLLLFINIFRRIRPLNIITIFMVIGYLVAHTVSSLPGFNISFFMISVMTLYYSNKLIKN